MRKNFLARVAAVMMGAALTIGMVNGLNVKAAEAENVKVSISDGTGIVLAAKDVAVTDTDGDGALTIADALSCAHEQNFADGAEGFGASETEYGLSMTKLWGIENGGSYGYYVNNASAWSLADPVKAGDYVYAFVYSDTATWSDTYCFFDKTEINAVNGDTVELTLHMYGYDENWNTVETPVEGAEITINGIPTGITTDADGKVSYELNIVGNGVVSAVSENVNLVPAVCLLNVTAAGDNSEDTAETATETETENVAETEEEELPKTGACALVWFLGGAALVGTGSMMVKKER